MLVNAVFAAGLGASAAVGLVGLAVAANRRDASQDGKTPRAGGLRCRTEMGWSSNGALRCVALAIGAGLATALLTGWVAVAPFAGFAAVFLPRSLSRPRPGTSSRTAEAVAGWTEMIRDSLASSAGLAQAILATAPSAPLEIRDDAAALATRLSNGISLENGLRAFASDVDDPAADLVVCALLMAASSRAQRLVDVLTSLVDSIRETVAMRLRVDASRASAQSGVRTITVFSLAFALVLSLAARSYLAPFGSTAGQLVLLLVGGSYAGGLALMIRMVRPVPEARLFDPHRLR